MEKRRIAFVGLADHSVQACLSMLGIMSSMSSVAWVQSDPEDADVLFVTVDSQDEVPANKLLVLLYRNDQTRPASTYSLPLPFRAMPLATLLEDIYQKHLDKPVKSEAPDKKELALYQSLAEIMEGSQELPGILPLTSDNGTFYVEPRSRSFFASEAQLQHLDRNPVHFHQLLTRIANPPNDLAQRPIFMLGWHMVKRSSQLLPWLDQQAHFQLKSWPYLGSLPKSRERLTLCALLSKAPLSRPQLLQLAKCSDEALDRFLNASAVSGFLRIDRSQMTAVKSISNASSSRFGGLIRGLRTRLGLTA